MANITFNMSWLHTKRIIRSGWINFKRSGVISVASILVLTITLCIITSLIFLQAVLQTSLAQIKDKVDVTVYFTPGAPEDKITELKTSLEKLPEVSMINYTSSDEAILNFRERHKNDYLTIQALDELNDNPLGASLNIKAKDPSQYESIASLLSPESELGKDNAAIISKVNYNENKLVIERLNKLINGASDLGLIVTLVSIIIAIVVTFNTIRLTIYISREEIGIMRLVGAENRYIRGPFMMEGIIYGVFSALITMVIFYPITLWLGHTLTDFLGINLNDYYVSNFFQIFLIIVLFGVILGMISSYLAIRKYLKK
jgi:cell division transport system permease protein